MRIFLSIILCLLSNHYSSQQYNFNTHIIYEVQTSKDAEFGFKPSYFQIIENQEYNNCSLSIIGDKATLKDFRINKQYNFTVNTDNKPLIFNYSNDEILQKDKFAYKRIVVDKISELEYKIILNIDNFKKEEIFVVLKKTDLDYMSKLPINSSPDVKNFILFKLRDLMPKNGKFVVEKMIYTNLNRDKMYYYLSEIRKVKINIDEPKSVKP